MARLAMVGIMLAMSAAPARAQDDGDDFAGCPEYILTAFGERSRRACGIAWCETGGTFDNAAIGRAGEVSIFQIHPIHFRTYDRQRLIDDPEYATSVAFEMSSGGRNWQAWSCS